MIRLHQVGYRYPGGAETFALREVSLDFALGQRLALMGANGSGKTTLIHAMLGLLPLSSGSITVDGLDVSHPQSRHEIRRRVGLMFQNPDNQMVATTVERELAFGLENLATPPEVMRRRVDEALDRFGLASYRMAEPHRLSGGERQRLALASVWVMAPRYLILDEPTSLLDPKNRREVLRLLDEEMGGREMGVLLVTQLPDETLDCDRVLIMDQGRLVMDAPPEAAFADAAFIENLGLERPVRIVIDRWLEGRP